MSCPSCHRFYNSRDAVPLNVPCGHTFCQACLEASQKKSKTGLLKCESCGQKFNKPIAEFSRNFIALFIGGQHSEKASKYKMCLKHESEPLKFFCEQCEVAFCPSCIVAHPGHRFVEQKFSVEAVHRKLEALRKKLKSAAKKVAALRRKNEEGRQFLEKSAAQTESEFDSFFARAKTELQIKESQLKRDLLARCETEERTVDGSLSSMRALEAEMRDLRRQCGQLTALLGDSLVTRRPERQRVAPVLRAAGRPAPGVPGRPGRGAGVSAAGPLQGGPQEQRLQLPDRLHLLLWAHQRRPSRYSF